MKSEYNYQVGDEVRTVVVERAGDRFRVTLGEQVYEVAAQSLGEGQLWLNFEGRQRLAHVAQTGSRRYVALEGQTWLLEQSSGRSPRRGGPGAHPGHDTLAASMPGQVIAVLVATGDAVERGQSLVLLEAMKMELRLTAPHAGRVSGVHCQTGQVVERGQVLVEIEEAGG